MEIYIFFLLTISETNITHLNWPVKTDWPKLTIYDPQIMSINLFKQSNRDIKVVLGLIIH